MRSSGWWWSTSSTSSASDSEPRCGRGSSRRTYLVMTATPIPTDSQHDIVWRSGCIDASRDAAGPAGSEDVCGKAGIAAAVVEFCAGKVACRAAGARLSRSLVDEFGYAGGGAGALRRSAPDGSRRTVQFAEGDQFVRQRPVAKARHSREHRQIGRGFLHADAADHVDEHVLVVDRRRRRADAAPRAASPAGSVPGRARRGADCRARTGRPAPAPRPAAAACLRA